MIPLILLTLLLGPQPTRTVTMDVSAYCVCSKCCGKHADGITASGRKAVGKIIAAPRSYKYGTVMHIPGYGVARVWDRGGAIKTAGNVVSGKRLRHDRIDLLFPTHRAALQWGRRTLKVGIR